MFGDQHSRNHHAPRNRLLRSGAVLAVGIVILAWTAPARAAEPETAAPETTAPKTTSATLTAAEPLFDFGEMVKGDEAVHTFTVHNPGDKPVTIERVAPVGCTITSYDKTIPPGGDGHVTLSINTQLVNGPGVSMAELLVPGKEEPVLKLKASFKVTAKISARPGFARWLYVQHERTGTIAQTVFSVDGNDFDVVKVESPMDSIKVSYREATPEERVDDHPGKQWRILATLDEDAPVGPVEGYIKVHTTHPRQKELFIPVSGFVRPMLFLSPVTGEFGMVNLTKPDTFTYHVRNFADELIDITGASVDVPGISAKVEPVTAGREYRVILTFTPAEMKKGPFAGTLRVESNSKKVPELTLHITGIFDPETAKKDGSS